jgi:hypothetical protein
MTNTKKQRKVERRGAGAQSVPVDRQVDKTVVPVRAVMSDLVRRLPVWRGWTVDERLREFRVLDRERGLVFVAFDSAEGAVLLAAYRRERAGGE